MQLRDYQQECLEKIAQKGAGRWLCQLATGMGKTVIFSRIPRGGRTLILAHREELVKQPGKYFDCPIGIEMAGNSAGNEPVVCASVQTLAKRLDKFQPDTFETIIVD